MYCLFIEESMKSGLRTIHSNDPELYLRCLLKNNRKITVCTTSRLNKFPTNMTLVPLFIMEKKENHVFTMNKSIQQFPTYTKSVSI